MLDRYFNFQILRGRSFGNVNEVPFDFQETSNHVEITKGKVEFFKVSLNITIFLLLVYVLRIIIYFTHLAVLNIMHKLSTSYS